MENCCLYYYTTTTAALEPAQLKGLFFKNVVLIRYAITSNEMKAILKKTNAELWISRVLINYQSKLNA